MDPQQAVTPQELIDALKRLIPILRWFAKMTPSTTDDKAVDWLEKFLSSTPAVQAAHAQVK